MTHPATLRFLTTGVLLFAVTPACSTNPDCSETRTCPGDRAPDASGLEGEGGAGGTAITGGGDTGGAPPRASGGRDPRGVGARSGIGNAGEAAAGQGGEGGSTEGEDEGGSTNGEGGSTDEPVDPPRGTEPGAACDDDEARLCDGAASDTVLVCTDGTWRAETCDEGSLCDSRDGTCAPIAPGCESLAPGAAFCSDNLSLTCGPDLVTAEEEVCEGRCVAGACVSATCGDAVVQEGEDCDDGNDVDTDACPSTCHAARCGDGFVLTGSELCDDGNSADTDDCPTNCKPADCGDGFVHEGAEECDDENFINTDDCLTTCEAARCGDGLVHDTDEECDDGNDDDTDACPTSCDDARCGDGFVLQDEEDCDIGDVDVGDGCSASCQAEPVALALGGGHSCALLGDGRLKCWGRNGDGQLGFGDPNVDLKVGDRPEHMGSNLPTVMTEVTSVSAGLSHTCAVQRGVVKCWGLAQQGQLGVSIATFDSTVVPVTVETGGTALQVCAGEYSTFVLHEDGTVKGWGQGAGSILPGAIGPFSSEVVALACGGNHVCARLSTGAVECRNEPNRSNPVIYSVPVANSPILLARNTVDVCALGSNGSLACSQGGSQTPIATTNPGWPVQSLSAAGFVICALSVAGQPKCWGSSEHGALGQPNVANADDPSVLPDIDIGAQSAKAIATSGYHTCVVLSSGRVRCWGSNASGRLGIGSSVDYIGDDFGEMGDELAYTVLD